MTALPSWLLLAAIVGPALLAAGGHADAALSDREPIQVELISERSGLVPGATARLGVRLVHAPGWHTYWRNPGDSGLPTELHLDLAPGWTAGPFEWPKPGRHALGPLANHGYEGDTLLPFRIQVPADRASAQATLRGKVTYLACKNVCIPGEAQVSLRLPMLDDPAASMHAPEFARADADAVRPDPGLRVRAFIDDKSLVLETSGASAPTRAEFFPYEAGISAPPAPQHLVEHGDGWLLRTTRPAHGAIEPGAIDRIAGVLVIDGRGVEIAAPIERGTAPSGGRTLATIVPSGADPALDAPAMTSDAALAFGRAVSLALLGGLLLNLMPCVLPVIGLKALTMLSASQAGSARRAALAWAYAGGVITTFLGLATLMLAMRAAGVQVGWGFQLESPAFLAAMTLLFFMIGLNLLGVFEVRGPSVGVGPASRASAVGAFGEGVLGTLVATPCSAPFMGAAIGYTLGQPALQTLAVFFALGLGLALPVVAITIRPGLISRLPKPGPWMVSLRRVLSLPMFATVVWLAWLLVRRTDATSVLTLGAALLLSGIAAALFGTAAPSRRVRLGLRVGAAGALASAILVASPQAARDALAWLPQSGVTTSVAWEPYSRARLDELRATGRIVFVEFTADWCVVCQANDVLVLSRPWAKRLFGEHSVALLRADWTRQDAAITQALAELDRNSVPVYAVYAGSAATPRVLPELLTRATLENAIAQARTAR